MIDKPQFATAAVDGFIKNLPPGTKADEVRLAGDFAYAIKADFTDLMSRYGPQWPIVGGFVRGSLIKVFSGFIDYSVGALSAAVAKSPQGSAK